MLFRSMSAIRPQEHRSVTCGFSYGLESVSRPHHPTLAPRALLPASQSDQLIGRYAESCGDARHHGALSRDTDPATISADPSAFLVPDPVLALSLRFLRVARHSADMRSDLQNAVYGSRFSLMLLSYRLAGFHRRSPQVVRVKFVAMHLRPVEDFG